MNLKLVAVGIFMAGVVMTSLLTTTAAVAQKNEPNSSMQNFTADEQRAAIQGGRAGTVIIAEAPQAASVMAAAPATSKAAEPSTWSVPVAIWLAASGLVGMGLLQRRKR